MHGAPLKAGRKGERRPQDTIPKRRPPRTPTVHEQGHVGRARARDALHAQHIPVLCHHCVCLERVACAQGRAGSVAEGSFRQGGVPLSRSKAVAAAGQMLAAWGAPTRARAHAPSCRAPPAIRMTWAVGDSYSPPSPASPSHGMSQGVWSKRPTLRVRRSLVIGRPGCDSSARVSCKRGVVGGRWGEGRLDESATQAQGKLQAASHSEVVLQR